MTEKETWAILGTEVWGYFVMQLNLVLPDYFTNSQPDTLYGATSGTQIFHCTNISSTIIVTPMKHLLWTTGLTMPISVSQENNFQMEASRRAFPGSRASEHWCWDSATVSLSHSKADACSAPNMRCPL